MSSRFPSSVSDSSRPFFEKNAAVGPAGADAVYVYPAVPVVPIPSDNDGGNPSYASASSAIYVYIAGVLQSGWTLAYISGNNCSATINNSVEPRTITIANVTADSGHAYFSASKSGVILYFRVYFSKVKTGLQGATGSQGAQGNQGIQGVQGDAGTPGTGLVIIKKEISVDAGVAVTVSDAGGGETLLTFSAAHGYSVGDWIHVFNGIGTPYDDEIQVSTVPTTDTLTIAKAYSSATGVSCYPMDSLRAINDSGGQSVVFPDILQPGMKLLEFQFICVTSSGGSTITVSMGDEAFPAGGYLSYFANEYSGSPGQASARDLRSNIYMRRGETDNDIWMRFVGSQNWLNQLSAYEAELHIAYINYDSAYTP